jgi:hypothetical protein
MISDQVIVIMGVSYIVLGLRPRNRIAVGIGMLATIIGKHLF